MSVVKVDPNAPHPGLIVGRFGQPLGFDGYSADIVEGYGPHHEPVPTTASDAPTVTHYRVMWPSVIVRGKRGSHGTFYEGALLRSWQCGGRAVASDEISDDCLERLLASGAVAVI